ncbi:Charged multivesicular body protein 6 [Strongyloides ratti]|uniref:Charged multivesicular body protein 6 n=1 Tax=Strongyloides ratti TaxID=34506 RepID=A0A090LDB4_STRRB|nr:Charged multivesicular body protein 6 [Strongyloides ratti]CEF67727.1 Charged multivesicular body protein 6 [Strongyloides ratti]
MGGLFTKSKKEGLINQYVTSQDQAILDLKIQRDKMKTYIKKSEKTIAHDKELARELLNKGMKDRALLMLKKKKYLEKMIEKTEKQLDTIQRMVNDIEFATIQSEVVNKLRAGNEALKKMNQMIDLDEIDKIMEETKEGAEFQEEISNMLSGAFTQQDEEDLEAELERLTEQDIDEKLVGLPKVPENDIDIKETGISEQNIKVSKAKKNVSKVLAN